MDATADTGAPELLATPHAQCLPAGHRGDQRHAVRRTDGDHRIIPAATARACRGLVPFRPGQHENQGEQFGGVDDEWVVIEAAHRAVKLAARIAGTKPGESVFGRFTFASRFNTFRNWVNSDEGVRLGFAAIPDGRVTAPMLRRTLSLELAHRPNGLFAAKLHLKHISVATTEGYAKARELHQTGEEPQVGWSWLRRKPSARLRAVCP